MEILRCEHLSKIYGSGDTGVHALKDVSFSVKKGEFVSITGPSGSGKSTLLHILGGVDRPTKGSVCIGGTNIHSLNEDRLAIFLALILITHDESIALQADRMLCMEDGEIVRDERIRVTGGEFL